MAESTIHVYKGTIVQAPSLGALESTEAAYLVTESGRIAGVFDKLPGKYQNAACEDFGDCLIVPAFTDLHLHAPQYCMMGMGFDLPLLEWLNAYTFREEARFADAGFARTVYEALAAELVRRGTTRVCMFSSLHREGTLILMDALERAGIVGLCGQGEHGPQQPGFPLRNMRGVACGNPALAGGMRRAVHAREADPNAALYAFLLGCVAGRAWGRLRRNMACPCSPTFRKTMRKLPGCGSCTRIAHNIGRPMQNSGFGSQARSWRTACTAMRGSALPCALRASGWRTARIPTPIYIRALRPCAKCSAKGSTLPWLPM